MGLQGCPASFAKMMDAIFSSHANVVAYIDDLLVHSGSWQSHLKHLELAFKLLRQHNLKLNIDKCEFGAKTVHYLGHTISEKGVKPSLDKVKAIRELKPPATVKEVKHFLGMANFFRNHIVNFARIALPLFALTRQDSKWRGGDLGPAELKSFEEIKVCLLYTSDAADE